MTQQALNFTLTPRYERISRRRPDARLARSGGMVWSKHRPLVFVDIETTGGSTQTSRITEIGLLRVENGQVVRAFSQLINPEVPIPRFITRLTGISDRMVANAPTFEEVSDELESLLEGAVFVAHVVQFDYGFIKAEYARLGRRFNTDRLCSVQLDRLLHPEQPRHGLDHVIKRLGVFVAERHRAFDDAEVLWKMFRDEYRRDSYELFRAMQKLLIKTR
jgi:DNA polymerase-3 subunit epsilon